MSKHRRGNRHGSFAPIEKIRDLYRSGLSCRQIEAKTGWSNSRVSVITRDIARSRRDAILLRVPPPKDTKHWRTCRARARKLVEQFLSRKLERSEHVHHKNHDYTDNRIENLEVLNVHDHARHHHPPNPIPRHLRPERQAYMKKYLKEYNRRK
jgi:hypothetical protein